MAWQFVETRMDFRPHNFDTAKVLPWPPRGSRGMSTSLVFRNTVISCVDHSRQYNLVLLLLDNERVKVCALDFVWRQPDPNTPSICQWHTPVPQANHALAFVPRSAILSADARVAELADALDSGFQKYRFQWLSLPFISPIKVTPLLENIIFNCFY